jgi:lipoprotein-releasing system permease protein
MTRLEWSIAWRYLRTRRESPLLSFISMIAVGGVIVGVSALIVILGVMNGLQRDLRDKILLGSPDIRVLTYSDDLRMPDWRSALEVVRAQPGVLAAAPYVLTEALATTNAGFAEGVSVQGLPQDTPGMPAVTDIRHSAVDGDFRFATGDGRRQGAVIGKLLADRIQRYVGDTLVIISPGGSRLDAFLLGLARPRFEVFPITGVFSTGLYDYDSKNIYLDLQVAQRLAGLGDAVSGIEVRTTTREVAPVVATQLDSALGYPYRTTNWQEQNGALLSALKLEKLAMTVILLLIVIVAAFNIISTLTMVVRDKTREIGILKAMGLRARSVRNVFLLQGVVIGALGTGIGAAVGLGAAYVIDRYHLIPLDPQIYLIDRLPVTIQVVDTVFIVVASVIIATLATLYPARQAARLYPVDAIRYE